MPHVIVLTPFVPATSGHGGSHRSYQIHWECARVLGASNVVTVSARDWWNTSLASVSRGQARRLEWTRRLTKLRRNPRRLLSRTGFSRGEFSFPGLIDYYEAVARATPKPAVCLIEHGGFDDFIGVNDRLGIPTVACPQNLESLDAAPLRPGHTVGNCLRLMDFSAEFAILARCAERLFISKVEAGLIGGLGLTARYYPYLPVGDIAEGLDAIRRRRESGAISRGLFLVMGTALHRSTRDAMQWFVDRALSRGLPDGTRAVVVGSGTERLVPKDATERQTVVECRGWVSQKELDDLLSRAAAVLIPQTHGFGALTRLTELTYTGAPVLVSRHPTMAMDPLSDLHVVGDEWDDWFAAMELIKDGASSVLGVPQERSTPLGTALGEVLQRW